MLKSPPNHILTKSYRSDIIICMRYEIGTRHYLYDSYVTEFECSIMRSGVGPWTLDLLQMHMPERFPMKGSKY